ncbi:MAG: carbamoyltransferase HypF [Ignavibacteria bacterium]|nr:carbamoyltransferase HypF [Ignavibacteria bacterium]
MRMRIVIRGAVQGVGFRPFVYRLASELGLVGWVSNTTHGVFIEVDGPPDILQHFLLRLGNDRPPRSFIQSLEHSLLDAGGFTSFEIVESQESGEKSVFILPDLATCPDCREEISSPRERRYRYPFTNCTNCGPRFSIITSLPYDRMNTSMSAFAMCNDCRQEYENPRDRRFHAQPIACPQCGPQLQLWNSRGAVTESDDAALRTTVMLISSGKVAAIKGLGGFHLVVDARNDEAVRRLRTLKHREEKPFALMFPSLEAVRRECHCSPIEARLLQSSESPIVLLRRTGLSTELSPSVAPRNPNLGIMLPYTPLHHLLMSDLGYPIVATSGNLSDEPICTREDDALVRLNGIADAFLVHNRPIVRHVDDSIVRVLMGRELLLRRARGYAPLPLTLRTNRRVATLATGAHLKNTVALAIGSDVFISQHIGDLETQESTAAFHAVIRDLQEMYEAGAKTVVCDLHPDYYSTTTAERMGIPLTRVQHHYAHVFGCMAENELTPPVLGVSWDGTGYGPDGSVWGGEFLAVSDQGLERVASLKRFVLPGGDRAVREPRRVAIALLYELYGETLFDKTDMPSVSAFTPDERNVLRRMLTGGINTPATTSAGRLFDGVASLIGLRQRIDFEGQAAMELEFLLAEISGDDRYPIHLSPMNEIAGDASPQAPGLVIDWKPMVAEIVAEVRRGTDPSRISLRFHNSLVHAIGAVCARRGIESVVLTGGCFQNRYLTEATVSFLTRRGFKPYWHQRIPPNDGGISFGQIASLGFAAQPNPGTIP